MSWDAEIAEGRRRRSLAADLGGAERVALHHQRGKLTVRERITALADPHSFEEIGSLTGTAEYDELDGSLRSFVPANFVAGLARVDGRPCVISGDDYTVRAGSDEATIPAKREFAERIATELGLPHVRLVDGMSGGGSVKSVELRGYTSIPGTDMFHAATEHLTVAPSVSLALGTIAGAGAVNVVLSHYSVIVRGTAQMMIAGPALVDQAALGNPDKSELGDASIHVSVGTIDDVVDDEHEAFDRARLFLSYLPTNVWTPTERVPSGDSPGRADESLLDIVPHDPKKPYDMRSILASVFDIDSFFEIGRSWGLSALTGFARLDGWPVAVFAENPMVYGGAWTADAARKITRLIDLASMFHLPLVHLQDCPGLLIGIESERSGTARAATSALVALSRSTSPYCSIVVRKAFGVGGSANKKLGTTHFRYAWPSGDWGSLPLEGGLEASYRADLEGLEGDVRAEAIAAIRERLNRVRSPYRAAEHFNIEEIIDPRSTRQRLCDWVDLVMLPKPFEQPYWTYRP